jgi:tellurite resistance protein
MAIALLLALAAVVALSCLLAGIAAAVRLARRLEAVEIVEMRVGAESVRPGAPIDVAAIVVARGGKPITVNATLVCTMFDHRARVLFSTRVAMEPAPGRPHTYRATLEMPRGALRTGAAGNELSALFSDEARRLLVSWTVELEVARAGVTVHRESRAIEVPEGAPLRADQGSTRHMVVDTFASLHDDLLVNWLVHMAMRNGEISPGERELLHDVLRTSDGVSDPAEADARIEDEGRRTMKLDPRLLRQHVPVDKRMAFYGIVYLMAWRDGTYDRRERAFALETLNAFGLDRSHAREVELGVLREMAKSALDHPL